jgi:hypothetical protein
VSPPCLFATFRIRGAHWRLRPVRMAGGKKVFGLARRSFLKFFKILNCFLSNFGHFVLGLNRGALEKPQQNDHYEETI